MVYQSTLVLDPRIRDWVIFPILMATFLVGLIRNYLFKYMRQDKKAEEEPIRIGQTLLRSKKLRSNSNYIPLESFLKRKGFFNNTALQIEVKNSGAPNPMDPEVMMSMMTQNASMIIQQVALMSWVSYFFSGFVLLRLPFPLTHRFKPMLQRGIDLFTLDTSYVSSISWYFLTMSGMRGIFTLTMGSSMAADDMMMMGNPAMMAAGGVGGPGAPEPAKILQAERENIELITHKFALQDIEARLLNKKQ